MKNGRALLRCHGRSDRVVRSRPYFTLWRFAPPSPAERERAARLYAESLSLKSLETGFLRTPLMYPFSVPVEKALEQYEKLTGAKTNRNKSSGLWLGAWKGVALPGVDSWTDGPVRILGV